MSQFKFVMSRHIPFQDQAAWERCRAIRKKDLTKHANPGFKIQIIPDSQLGFLWLADMFHRIKTAADENRKVVLITPQPWADGYGQLAYLINQFRVNCRNLYTFNMDEYADENGQTPPENWPQGFLYSMVNFFYNRLDADLRPPRCQINGPSSGNIKDYGKMLADLGGADCCYSGPGWTGHLAFIEPDAPEFAGNLEEWKQMGPRICTLSALTIGQNSLHGHFGMSGDLSAVPPKAATIGPAEVIGAKHRFDMHAITIDGSYASWQRIITRLCLHGPVTPRMPASILQTLRTDVYVSETAAQDIEPLWDKGY